MTVCDCRHEREGRCTLMPKVLAIGGDPMTFNLSGWAFPPADAPCGQQAPREAVPCKRCGGIGFVNSRNSSVPCPTCRPIDYATWQTSTALHSTPPAAAPAPSEAAKAWCHRAATWRTFISGEVTRDGFDDWIKEAVALIAAAEQRAESAERDVADMRKALAFPAKMICVKHMSQEQTRCVICERDDLRAKLAAAELRAAPVVDYFGQKMTAAELAARAKADHRHAKQAEKERDAARGRAVEVLRELDAKFAADGFTKDGNIRGTITDKIAAEEARGKLTQKETT